MSDARNAPADQIAEFIAEIKAAHVAWRPDAACIAAGDDALDLAIRGYAAAGMTDQQIADRVMAALDSMVPWTIRHDDAAIAVARHAALAGLPLRRIVAVLNYLAAEVGGWPDDPDELAFIARAAVKECGA